MIEIIGLLATVLVLVSFLYKNELHIRVVNIFGALLFVVYGILISSLSVWLLNGALVIIHVNRIIKLKNKN